MITELQIAQELYEKFKKSHTSRAVLERHLADCQRQLSFLKSLDIGLIEGNKMTEKVHKKISDLQSTILFYESKGIKI